MLTTRFAPHDRRMCSQAAARQWSLHTQWLYKSWVVAFDVSACRGAMATFHRFAACVERERSPDQPLSAWLYSLLSLATLRRPHSSPRPSSRSAATSVRAQNTLSLVRGRHLRLSRASRDFRESSSASETDSGCTIAESVAEGRLAAGFITISLSQQKLFVF